MNEFCVTLKWWIEHHLLFKLKSMRQFAMWFEITHNTNDSIGGEKWMRKIFEFDGVIEHCRVYINENQYLSVIFIWHVNLIVVFVPSGDIYAYLSLYTSRRLLQLCVEENCCVQFLARSRQLRNNSFWTLRWRRKANAYTCSLIGVIMPFSSHSEKLSIPLNCANCRIATDPFSHHRARTK